MQVDSVLKVKTIENIRGRRESTNHATNSNSFWNIFFRTGREMKHKLMIYW